MIVATWQTEFGRAYDVPEIVANDPRLVDVSWHNDGCPSFVDARLHNDADGPRLWIEHPDPAQRECSDPALPRFIVSPAGVEDGSAWSGAKGNVYEGEDAAEAVAALLGLIDNA